MKPLPALSPDQLESTLAALHEHSRVLGDIRRKLTPRRRHWSHVTLHVTPTGLTTTPMPAPAGAIDLTLDLIDLSTTLRSNDGRQEQVSIRQLSPAEHHNTLCRTLESFGTNLDSEDASFSEEIGDIQPAVARDYQQVLSSFDLILKRFAGGLRQETSPVQLFPHHFDLAVSWFSGRLVPGEDPDDEDAADEQLTFGFAPPDASIQRPYVYVTAYPKPQGWGEFDLPAPGRWHAEGFQAAVIEYDDLVELDNPEETLLQFLHAVQARASELMND